MNSSFICVDYVQTVAAAVLECAVRDEKSCCNARFEPQFVHLVLEIILPNGGWFPVYSHLLVRVMSHIHTGELDEKQPGFVTNLLDISKKLSQLKEWNAGVFVLWAYFSFAATSVIWSALFLVLSLRSTSLWRQLILKVEIVANLFSSFACSLGTKRYPRYWNTGTNSLMLASSSVWGVDFEANWIGKVIDTEKHNTANRTTLSTYSMSEIQTFPAIWPLLDPSRVLFSINSIARLKSNRWERTSFSDSSP